MARAPELSSQAHAFLDTVAWSEGTSTSPVTRDDGYDVIVSSIDTSGRLVHERFDDYSDHPFEGGRVAKHIKGTLFSTAAGRYQDILRTWHEASALLDLRDFSPENQDRANWFLIQRRKAAILVEAGEIEKAIALCSPEWASLPGKGYPGQPQRKMAQCLAMFQLKGGSWNSSLA